MENYQKYTIQQDREIKAQYKNSKGQNLHITKQRACVTPLPPTQQEDLGPLGPPPNLVSGCDKNKRNIIGEPNIKLLIANAQRKILYEIKLQSILRIKLSTSMPKSGDTVEGHKKTGAWLVHTCPGLESKL